MDFVGTFCFSNVTTMCHVAKVSISKSTVSGTLVR
jgi:hypothetical protein